MNAQPRGTTAHRAIPHRAGARLRGTPKAQPRRALRLVAPVANRARRTPFVVVLLTLIGLGLIGLILISTAMQAQTFQLARLSSQARDLQTTQESLQRDVSELKSPRTLGPKALWYGMVPSQTPVYLRLSDGQVIGSPKPAEARTNLEQVIR